MTLRRAWLPIGLLAAVMALPLLGARDLWAPDEPRYAEVAQEMLRDGHWWYPHVNGRRYPDKPPLYFWLEAAAGSVRGTVDEGAARLPSALAHVALVLLTWHLARRLFGETAAVVAALALATTWLQAWMSRRACLDVLLSLCAAGAIALCVAARDAAEAGRGRRAFSMALAAGAVTGLGFMTKGPVVLLPVMAAVAFAWRGWAAPPGGPRRILAASAAIAGLAIVLALWLVPAHAIAGYTPLAIAREQVLDRAAEGRNHHQPPWYFLVHLPLDFMPWTLAALPAIAWAWGRRRDRAIATTLAWALLPVVAHSVIVEKRNIYVLPEAPAWAMLTGAWIATTDARAMRRVLAACALLLGLLGVGALAMPFVPLRGVAAEALAMPGVPWTLATIGLACLVAAIGLAWEVAPWGETRSAGRASRRRGPVRAAVALALAFGFVESGLLWSLGRFDALKSGRGMGEAIRRHASGGPAGMTPRTWDAYVYYSGRTLDDIGEGAAIGRWLAKVPRPAHVVAYRADVPALPLDGPAPPRIVHVARVGHREVVLLRYGTPSETP